MLELLFRKTGQAKLDLDGIQAIFFDLDGTLIDVDMHRFIPGYLRRLTGYMSDQVNPSLAIKSMHRAVASMFANTDARKTLESILLDGLQSDLSVSAQSYAECLELFYRNDLDSFSPLISRHPLSPQLIDSALARGWKVILATNPIFPREVIDARLSWGGLDGAAFHHVTAYETAHFCKPSPAFFEELLDLLQLPASSCLMVGNDTLHDLSASRVGMQTCLLTPWRIDRPGESYRADWQGDHRELLDLIASTG